MANDAQINIPFNHDLRCPVCNVLLDIVVSTNITPGAARTGSRDGLGRAINVDVSVSARPELLIIERHACVIDKED